MVFFGLRFFATPNLTFKWPLECAFVFTLCFLGEQAYPSFLLFTISFFAIPVLLFH